MTFNSTNAELEFLRRVSDWGGPRRLSDLDDAVLRELTRIKGIDFATALLYQAILESADHGPFSRRVEELLLDTSLFDRKIDAALVVVPGAFYREHPETGADGKDLCRAAASLGCRTHVIPTQSVGGSAVNARIICDWLCEQPAEPIILCSLSKGGADVKMALAQSDNPLAFRHVVAWLNVGGITAGSPMSRWVLERSWLALLYRTIFWWRGQDFRFITDLDRRAGALLDFHFSPPAHLRTVHVLGFPLAHHIHQRRTRRWHRRLACYGPNDGATILSDSCQIPGLIFPVWGADHYLGARYRPEQLLGALLKYLAEELNLFRIADRSSSGVPSPF